MMHTQAGAPMTSYGMKPLGCDPQHVKGMSEKLIVSHYWGKGKAADLARSLRRVLDAQAAVKS